MSTDRFCDLCVWEKKKDLSITLHLAVRVGVVRNDRIFFFFVIRQRFNHDTRRTLNAPVLLEV